MMEEKTVKVMQVHAMLDEDALRTTLAQIEHLRQSPETAGLDLQFGAVVSLEITPELVGCDEPTLYQCHIRAGGWSPELSAQTPMRKRGRLQA